MGKCPILPPRSVAAPRRKGSPALPWLPALALGRVVQARAAVGLGHKGPTHRQADAELAHDLAQQGAGPGQTMGGIHGDFGGFWGILGPLKWGY